MLRGFHSVARLLLLAFYVSFPGASRGQAQLPSSIAVVFPDASEAVLPVEEERGYPVIPGSSLVPLGWTMEGDRVGGEVVLRHRTGLELGLTPGSPFVVWDGLLVQMIDGPYWSGEAFLIPLQLAVDLLPGFLPAAYAFDETGYRLRAEGAGVTELAPPTSEPATPRPEDVVTRSDQPTPPAWTPGPGPPAPTLVVIDPGHGGIDPGAIGASGTQEKDVVLAIGLALARELSANPDIEVRLTRDRDVEVPIWTRGEWATAWKGERPGAFVSIHVNALPDRSGVRGFETYFLSEARTEHERRVAAVENAPMSSGPDGPSSAEDPLLEAILNDLRGADYQQWSALLADQVQLELSGFHSGPDRGVKQGPFAVITNTLMPAVLVEIGFITNPEEERLLARAEFHRDAARAMARAIETFLDRYSSGGAR